MTSRRRLSSVCQSIAHHASSSLSWLHPHLLQVLREDGAPVASVDLLSTTTNPPALVSHPPLQSALDSVRNRFARILASEGFLILDLNEARLFFQPDGHNRDDYCCECHARLIHSSGRRYVAAVDCMGKSIVPKLANASPDACDALAG